MLFTEDPFAADFVLQGHRAPSNSIATSAYPRIPRRGEAHADPRIPRVRSALFARRDFDADDGVGANQLVAEAGPDTGLGADERLGQLLCVPLRVFEAVEPPGPDACAVLEVEEDADRGVRGDRRT